MRKSLKQKLEENGKLESAMSYADVKSSNVNSNKNVSSFQNNQPSLKERVEKRVSAIMSNTGNIVSNLGIGVKDTFINTGYAMQKSREIHSPEYTQTTLRQQNISNMLKANKNNQMYSKMIDTQKETRQIKGLKDVLNKDEKKIQENIDNTTGKASKEIAKIAPSMANSAVGMVAGMVNPVLGSGLFFTSATGGYMRDAENRGMTGKEIARYGTIMGAMEGATEFLGGELTKGVGKAIIKNGAKEGLKAFGLDIAENFLEEAVMEPIQETMATMIGGKDTADWSNMKERILESGVDGALTSIIMGGASAGVGSAIKISNKIKNGETISKSEIAKALEDTQKSGAIDVENILKSKIEEAGQQEYTNLKNSNQNQEIKMQNNEVFENSKQVIPKEQNQAQNANMRQTETSKTSNEKYNKFKQQLEENGLNYEDKRVNSMFDLPNKRGIDVEINTEVFKKADGSIDSNINAMYVTDSEGKRKIIYNPKANQDSIIEKNTIHEITHDLEGTKEYKKLSEMVLKKIENTAEFEKAYNSLKEAYSKVTDNEGRILYNSESEEFSNMIKQEAVADYLGENLGNQEYINELVNGKESRNIAQKIYDTIVNFLDKVTGYKSEEAYLRGLKNKFEKAFNAEYDNDNNGNMKYHISENFSKEIDKSLNGNISSNNQIKARDYTPKILVKNGVEDLPMLLTQKHLRQIIYTKEQAENLGYNIGKKDHYHGLGKEKLLKAIDNLDNPKEIYKQSDSNFLIITEIEDTNNNKIIVPIQISGKGTYNNLIIDENQILSVYGRENLENYLSKNNYEKIYEKNRVTLNEGVKSHDIGNSINSIPQSNSNGNTNNKYSMQENENNTGKWQEFLDQNSMNDGTKTTLNEIKLPQKKEVRVPELKDSVSYRTEKNMKKYPNAMKMPIEEILKYKTSGGYRTEEQINNLYKNIKENGIKYPIELIRNEDGKIEINNGNHRLEVAHKLGLKDVPVIYKDYADVDKIDTNMYDDNDRDILKYVEEHKIGNNGNSKETAMVDGRSRFEQESNSNNRFEFKNDRTATEDDRLYRGNEGYNNGSPSTTTSTKDIKKELEKSSSFSMEQNTLDGKQRKHYQTVYESENVGNAGKEVAKKLYKTDTYTPVSNASTVAEVNDYINKVGNDNAYSAFTTKIYDKSQRITLNDIATGERLIQIYSQTGDYAKVNELIQDVAILGTELGQQVQALSLVKRASPEGQLSLLNRIVDRTNTKNNTDLKLTDEMAEKILKSKNENELQNNVSLVAEEIANEIELKLKDKTRSWRYLSMLGNPRTHVRNLTANVFMNLVQNTKNKVSGGIQDVVKVFNSDYQATQTLKFANKESVEFAKSDAEVMVDQIDGGGKYDIQNIIESSKRQFDNKFLNWVAEKNSDLLEVEDTIFLKRAYQQAMQEYMTARKLKSSDMKGATLEKARQYACLQAQEATFHQYNELASKLSQIESKGGVLGKAVSAVLPFKKTPMNIAKEGIEYSPIGLLTTTGNMIKEINNTNTDLKMKLENRKITQVQYNEEISSKINKVIDGYAKGLTGSGIALLGYFLTQMGVLKAGNDGDDDEFEEELGKQTYSIQIGDNTYSLDWVAPAGIPLFIGSSLYQAMNNVEETDDIADMINNIATATVNSLEPMTEMSMLSSLTDLMTSYSQGNEVISEKVASTVNSYMGQFVPTAMSQVAKSTDTKVRSTTSTRTGFSKYVDQFIKQTQAKIPGLSQKLPVKKDIWGKDVERAENPILRTLETAILPYDRKKVINDMTNEALKGVFNETGEKSVLPSRPEKTITINGKKYRYDAKEYNQAQEQLGKTSKDLLNDLIKSSSYNKMTDAQKADAISNIYNYSKEVVKKNYADDNNVPMETSSLYNVVSKLEENNGNTPLFFEFKAKTDDMKKQTEKLDYLSKMKMNNQTKIIIYEDSFGKDDKVYNVLSKLQDGETNIEAYLDYKLQDFEGDEDIKSNIVGKKVSKGEGTTKSKTLKYIYNSKMTDIEKAYIIETTYTDELELETREALKALVEKKVTNKEEQDEILKKFKDLEKHKDGEWHWK